MELKRRNAVSEDDNRNLEAELQQHASSLLANRLVPLKAELERLQATFAEANARMLEQIQPTAATEETAGLATQVQSWLEAATAKAEHDFQERLRAEVERTREELSASMRQQFEAEFQDKLEQSNHTIRGEAEAEFEKLRSQIAELTNSQTLSPAATPPPTSFHYGQLRSAIETIDAQRTQSETLTTLLQLAAQFSPRVAFYVVKSGEAVGWKAVGFDNGLTDETVRALGVSIQATSLLGEALNTQRTAVALNPSQAEIAPILGRFSHPVPQGVVAVPLVVRGKAAAVLYADSGTASDDAVQLEALEALVHVASMAIELLPVRRNAPEVARPPLEETLRLPEAALLARTGQVRLVEDVADVFELPRLFPGPLEAEQVQMQSRGRDLVLRMHRVDRRAGGLVGATDPGRIARTHHLEAGGPAGQGPQADQGEPRAADPRRGRRAAASGGEADAAPLAERGAAVRPDRERGEHGDHPERPRQRAPDVVVGRGVEPQRSHRVDDDRERVDVGERLQPVRHRFGRHER